MESKLLKLRISSPGKVILHGEHSVVYKRPALAAVVGVRTCLHLAEDETRVLRFEFESLNWTFSLKLEDINDFLKNHDTSSLLNAVEAFAADKLRISDDVKLKTSVSVISLLAGAFLDTEQKQILKSFSIKITSELKIGAGLGSSASFGVCLASAFLILSGVVPPIHPLPSEFLELISLAAYNSEKIMHGNPSGVDNTICTYGGIVRFLKGQGFQQIACGRKLSILLVDSKVNRSTAKLVEKVAVTKEKFPKLMNSVMDAMEEVVNEAIPIYESGDLSKFHDLEQLFQINNDLLKAIGVSHGSLEKIFKISTFHGYSSKLTGAGGGGYAIVLLPERFKEEKRYADLCGDLEKSGFCYTETAIGGEGVCIEALD